MKTDARGELCFSQFLITIFRIVKLVMLVITIPTEEVHWMTVSGAAPLTVLPMSEML